MRKFDYTKSSEKLLTPEIVRMIGSIRQLPGSASGYNPPTFLTRQKDVLVLHRGVVDSTPYSGDLL